jgi:hypothetical protein
MAGAQSETLGLTAAEIGWTLRVRVTATGPSGSSSTAVSEPSAPVVDELAPNPDIEVDPAAAYYRNGTGTFTWASDAARSGARSLKIVSTQAKTALARWMNRETQIPVAAGSTYVVSAWLRTASVGNKALVSVVFSNGKKYSPATSSTTFVRGTQEWTPVEVRATAPAGMTFLRAEFRLYGPGTMWTDLVSVTDERPPPPPSDPPTPTEPPTLAGTAREGETMVGSNGVWTGDPTEFVHQWERCTVAGEACSSIAGAASPSYRLTGDDVGQTVRVRVTAENSAGSTSAASEPSEVVEAAPPVTNLAPNPDFEADPAASYYRSGTGTFTWATDAAYSGIRSLKIVSAQASGSIARWMNKVTEIPVTPGNTYRVSAWLKTAAVSNKALVAVAFSNGSTYSSAVNSASFVRGTSGWTLVETQATAPAGMTYLRAELRLSGPGTMWGDLLTVAPVP